MSCSLLVQDLGFLAQVGSCAAEVTKVLKKPETPKLHGSHVPSNMERD